MGKIIKVSGPLVVADGMADANMADVVRVGPQQLIGEILNMTGDRASIQVYEETSGLGPGADVVTTGAPLSVELGPGLIENIYDGIQRPLEEIVRRVGSNITRGIQVPPLDRDRLWDFTPTAAVGDTVAVGDILGTVPETESVLHKIMVPKGAEGTVAWLAEAGQYNITQPIARVKLANGEVRELTMVQKWPAAVPGPFGSGKTVVQHQLAKWADVDIVVYIGCGERGNEMTDVLREFPELTDPRTGESLMKRTVLIANTSDMPVAAREASVYTGITIAEYFRDMGYDVAVIADSTSRWAEALREMSGRLEEMPGEEGYPAYLASRLAQFYERAGVVQCLASDERTGSLTAVGAVSPPGGDLSEPVAQATMRIVKVFWSLDASLAYRRHFPAINWLNSYSLYLDAVTPWFNENMGEDFIRNRNRAMHLLQEENELNEIVQLVGKDSLSANDQLTLEIARMLREDFLQQNAFMDVDSYSSFDRQMQLLGLILHYESLCRGAVDKAVAPSALYAIPAREKLGWAKYAAAEEYAANYAAVRADMEREIAELIRKAGEEE